MAKGASQQMFRTLFLANVLYWVSAATYQPFMSAYFTDLGFDALQLGLLLTIMPLSCVLVQPLWSGFADRRGARKQTLVALCFLSAGASLLYWGPSSFVSKLLVTLLFSLFFSALLPLVDSLVIQAALENGLSFGRIRMGGTVGYAVVVAAAGALIQQVPITQFILVAASCVIFGLWCMRLPAVGAGHASPAHAEAVAHDGGTSATRRRGRIFDDPGITLVLSLAFVVSVGIGFMGTFLGRWCVELGYGQGLVGVLSAVSALSELPILYLSQRLVERFRAASILTVSCLAMVLRIVLLASGSVPVMIAAQLLQSITYMTAYFCCVTYIAEHTYPDTKAQGQAALTVVQSGVALIVANLAGGVMADAFGTQAAFYVAAAVVGALLVGALAINAALARNRRGAFVR